jgi:hypothetical protein
MRNEVIRKEPKISEIKDVRSKYKRNWINHLERKDNTRLPNTPQEKMATRRCRNTSKDIIHGGRRKRRR